MSRVESRLSTKLSLALEVAAVDDNTGTSLHVLSHVF